MAARARIELLGVFRVRDEDGDLVPVPQAHQRIVLAALALADGQGVTADALLDTLWPGELPRSGRKTLHGYIARLRRLLGADSILTQAGGYVLNTDRFEVDVQLAREHLEAGCRSDEPGERLRRFVSALGLFRGEPLQDAPAEPLHRAHAHVLRDLHLLTLEHWAREQIRVDPAEAVGPLREASLSHPHQESLWALLIDALTASGRRAEALEYYGRARRLLLDDLGIEPGPALRRAQQNALASPPAPRSAAGTSDDPGVPQARITDLLARRRAEGAAVAVVGPPGSGKSRTVRAVVDEVRRTGAAGQPPVVVPVRPGAGGSDQARVLAEQMSGIWGGGTRGADPAALREVWARSATLLVLDDVTHTEQYAWLLPVPPGSGLVVCTTVSLRTGRLEVVELPPYAPGRALAVLAQARELPPGGLPRSTVRVLDVVLEGLPAAVHALAERMADEPDLTWDEVGKRLQDPRRRLDLLASRSVDVRGHLHKAYDRLRDSACRAFRLLGWLDAHSFNDTAASAALDLSVEQAKAALAELVRAGLVRVDRRGSELRYQMNPLGRSFAREISDYTDDQTLRDAAVRRALSAWQSNPFSPAGQPTAALPWDESRGARPLMRP
ncbi:BTAD domain-containing putative transcriptional regulator [Streptomyces sp. NPDC005492]|uniref:AfsR/SARP family transcriptional regulator n=1 Tax=Streptomyces sp. NPDC005492 TaxID=3156883 RepID=UPI00339DAE62